MDRLTEFHPAVKCVVTNAFLFYNVVFPNSDAERYSFSGNVLIVVEALHAVRLDALAAPASVPAEADALQCRIGAAAGFPSNPSNAFGVTIFFLSA